MEKVTGTQDKEHI